MMEGEKIKVQTLELPSITKDIDIKRGMSGNDQGTELLDNNDKTASESFRQV